MGGDSNPDASIYAGSMSTHPFAGESHPGTV